MNRSTLEFNPNGVTPDNGNYFGMPVEADDAALVLISAPWDATGAQRDGSSYAPDAIIEASRHIDFYEPSAPGSWRKGIATLSIDYSIQDLSHRLRTDASRVVKVYEELGPEALDNIIYARRLRRVNEASERVNDNVYSQASKWLERNKIVGLVGGDQSSAYGLMRAVAEKYEGVGILHIDSKCDLKECYQGFEHSHASIMHNVLRDFAGVGKLVGVGIREFSHQEWERVESDERIKYFTGQYIWSSHFEGKLWSTISDEIVAELPDEVYVSLDIDGLTIECAPHNGTLIPGGIRFPEVVYLLSRIVAAGKRIVGFDLTEVVPNMDDKTDAEIAARMLFKLCSIALKNYDAEPVL